MNKRNKGVFMQINTKELTSFITNKLGYLDDFNVLKCSDKCDGLLPEDCVDEAISNAADMIGAVWGVCGASKSVFFFDEYPDIVFKIPFMGYGDVVWDDDEEEYYYDTSDLSECFMNTEYSDNNVWDYCEQEAYVYERAKDYRLEYLFAETIYLCDYNGYPIYIAEKMDEYSYGDKRNNCTKDSLAKARKYTHKPSGQRFDLEIIALFITCYGEESFTSLLTFLDNYNIYDFHDKNVGYDKDNNIRLLDYSDFCD